MTLCFAVPWQPRWVLCVESREPQTWHRARAHQRYLSKFLITCQTQVWQQPQKGATDGETSQRHQSEGPSEGDQSVRRGREQERNKKVNGQGPSNNDPSLLPLPPLACHCERLLWCWNTTRPWIIPASLSFFLCPRCEPSLSLAYSSKPVHTSPVLVFCASQDPPCLHACLSHTVPAQRGARAHLQPVLTTPLISLITH